MTAHASHTHTHTHTHTWRRKVFRLGMLWLLETVRVTQYSYKTTGISTNEAAKL